MGGSNGIFVSTNYMNINVSGAYMLTRLGVGEGGYGQSDVNVGSFIAYTMQKKEQ